MDALHPLIDFASRHRRLFVITGAGCSTAAGIADYRDANGAWKRPEPMRYELFKSSALARQRYWARSMLGWPNMAQAQPVSAHHALTRMERSGLAHCIVTQNVDGLHQAAGSARVIDLHGRIDAVICLGCGARLPRRTLQDELVQRNPAWQALAARSAPDGDADLEAQDFASFNAPACSHCGGVLKPDVVFFGESVPRERVQAARDHLAQADAVLAAGSSLMVYSGYRFVEEAVRMGKPVALINLGRTRADALPILKIEHDVGAALQALAEKTGGGVK